MYNVDSTILERFYEEIQTLDNESDPRPLVYLVRPTTPIQTQRFWEKTLITSTVGTRSSIAVRRPHGNLLGDMIFTAQVEAGGVAIIKYAEPKSNLKLMAWTTLTTIEAVSELSIMFDGYMESHEGVIESYTTGELPHVIYVDISGNLYVVDLNNPELPISISEDAVNVASVRGLYSESIGLDDGILIYYTNTAGELWEAILLGGAITELTQITMKPTGVTGWLDCWAERTFDYRIMLQLKGNDGKVYTLMSTSRTSGYSILEHLGISKIRVSGQIGLIPPAPLYAENVEV